MNTSPERADRRRFLSALAVAGSATVVGCAAIWNQAGATDVVAFNAATEPKVVSVTVTDTVKDIQHTSKTLELDPGEKEDPVNDGKLPTNASYAVEVNVEGGPRESFEWDDPT